MNFYEKYELLQLIRDDGVKSFEARERATGQTVAVHVLTVPPAESELLLEQARGLAALPKAHIKDIGEHDGTPYIVTGTGASLQPFREWLASERVSTGNPPPPAADRFTKAGSWRVPTEEFTRKAEPPPKAGPGEFTMMFQTPPRPPQPGEQESFTQIFARPAATPPIPEPEQPAPPAPDPEPEEPKPPQPPTLVQASPEPQPEKGEPGEFTRMFQVPAAPPRPEPPPPAAPPRANGPGEFTRMFQAPVGSPDPAAHPAMKDPFARPSPPPSYQPQVNEPGTFTGIFGVPSSPGQGNAPQPQHPMPGPLPGHSNSPPPSATGAFSAPAQYQPPYSPAPQGQGEYTRIFSTPAAPPVVQPPAPPNPEPSSASQQQLKPNYLPLILILGFLFVFAVALVLFFALAR